MNRSNTSLRWPRPLLIGLALLCLPMWQCYLDPGALTKLEKPILATVAPELPCDSLKKLQANPAYGERFTKMFEQQPKLWGCLVPIDNESYTAKNKGLDALVQPVWFDASSKLYTFDSAGKKLVPSLALSMPLDYVRARTFAKLFVGQVQDKPPSEASFQQLQAFCKQFLVPDFDCFSPAGQKICWLTIDFQPKATAGEGAFGMPVKDTPCKLCSPETCDGQDNDCNDKADDDIAADYACSQGLLCLKGKCDCDKSGHTYCPDLQACVDFQTDAKNCGKCGVACPGDQVCKSGACTCDKDGFTYCPDSKVCVDFKTDVKNCGACGAACNIGQKCDAGKCVCTTASLTFCAESKGCVDLQTDAKYCGKCGVSCFGGQVCKSGVCECEKAGYIYCSSVRRCIDPQTDSKHCGGCDKFCFQGFKCVAGKCECHNANDTACFDNRLCINRKLITHCGGCGQACKDSEVCTGGVCVCKGTKIQMCGGVCTNIYLDSNCGSCGNLSTEGNCFGGRTCRVVSGKCVCTDSKGVDIDPNNNPANNWGACGSFCANFKTNKNHCGKCDNKCAVGEICSGGVCQLPFVLRCAGKSTLISSDPNHCGKCDNKCPPTQQCILRECKCPNNFTFCQDVCVNTLEDADNCGACGTKCKPEQTCTKGVCK